MKNYHIAVVGATGAVGSEFMRVLEQRGFPVASLRPLGSSRSAGKSIRFGAESLTIEELNEHSFDKIDIAFFSAGSQVERSFVPVARQAGAVAIDNSPAFRMDPDVPLVITRTTCAIIGV